MKTAEDLVVAENVLKFQVDVNDLEGGVIRVKPELHQELGRLAQSMLAQWVEEKLNLALKAPSKTPFRVKAIGTYNPETKKNEPWWVIVNDEGNIVRGIGPVGEVE